MNPYTMIGITYITQIPCTSFENWRISSLPGVGDLEIVWDLAGGRMGNFRGSFTVLLSFSLSGDLFEGSLSLFSGNIFFCCMVDFYLIKVLI